MESRASIDNSSSPADFQSLLVSMAADKNLQECLKVILSFQESKELYRDTHRGFVLTAYTETEGPWGLMKIKAL